MPIGCWFNIKWFLHVFIKKIKMCVYSIELYFNTKPILTIVRPATLLAVCDNYWSFLSGRNLCDTDKQYSALQISASSPASVWRIIVREWKKGGRRNRGGEKLPPFAPPYVQESQEWRLVGRRTFHQTYANPSAPHGNNRLDVICFLPCSQGRDGERLGMGWRIEKGLGGVSCAPCCRGQSNWGPTPHVFSSSVVLPACLSSTALRSLFLYVVILIVHHSPYPVLLLSLRVDAGDCCLSSTCTCACVPFWSFLFSLQVSFCSCVVVFWFFCFLIPFPVFWEQLSKKE